jgi:hypothetical protein
MNTTLSLNGKYKYEQIRYGVVVDSWEDSNIVVDEGLNYILDSSLSAATVITTWYLGLFKNNYTPIAGNVAATFPGSGVANEATTEYNEAIRPTWVDAGASAKTLTNSASPAVFTFNTPVTIYGAFLVSTNTKGGTTGKLASASKFSTARSMVASDILQVTYTLTVSST